MSSIETPAPWMTSAICAFVGLSTIGSGACVAPGTEEAEGALGETRAVSYADCTAVPASFHDGFARAYHAAVGTVMVAPVRPAADQEAFVVLEALFPRYHGDQNASMLFTSDGWSSKAQTPMTDWCPNRMWPVWGASVGAHPAGTQVEVAIVHHIIDDTNDRETWLNNGTKNYPVLYEDAVPLEWIGQTHLRVDGLYIPAEVVTVGRPLEVYTETYPMGAARTVELHWSIGEATENVTPMAFDKDDAGSYGHNTQWKATLPAEVFAIGQTAYYWVSAVDADGSVIRDPATGFHTVTPRRFEIQWAGGLGSFRPSSHEYQEGHLFHDDLTTDMGCYNHGVSSSMYVERAARVWIPGLTDRRFSSENDRRAFGKMIRVQTVTDVPGPLATIEGEYAGQVGNDFVYTFMPFSRFCVSQQSAPADGTYGYKVRFSSDGGETWFTMGTESGGDGGQDLTLRFKYRCSYFNDPNDCSG